MKTNEEKPRTRKLVEMIKQVLGQDDELVLDNPKDITIPGLEIRRPEDKIIALGLWDNGTYTALVSENRLYALYLAFDEIADPMGLQSIRVSLAEDDYAERLYVDTADDPLFGAKFSRKEGDSWLLPVKDLDLSTRARNALDSGGVTTLGELVHMTEKELLRTRNFGVTSLYEVKELLKKRDMTLRGGLYKDPAHYYYQGNQ
jgi:hypothetical protein